jgi:hypothetical protein
MKSSYLTTPPTSLPYDNNTYTFGRIGHHNVVICAQLDIFFRVRCPIGRPDQQKRTPALAPAARAQGFRTMAEDEAALDLNCNIWTQ